MNHMWRPDDFCHCNFCNGCVFWCVMKQQTERVCRRCSFLLCMSTTHNLDLFSGYSVCLGLLQANRDTVLKMDKTKTSQIRSTWTLWSCLLIMTYPLQVLIWQAKSHTVWFVIYSQSFCLLHKTRIRSAHVCSHLFKSAFCLSHTYEISICAVKLRVGVCSTTNGYSRQGSLYSLVFFNVPTPSDLILLTCLCKTVSIICS